MVIGCSSCFCASVLCLLCLFCLRCLLCVLCLLGLLGFTAILVPVTAAEKMQAVQRCNAQSSLVSLAELLLALHRALSQTLPPS